MEQIKGKKIQAQIKTADKSELWKDKDFDETVSEGKLSWEESKPSGSKTILLNCVRY